MDKTESLRSLLVAWGRWWARRETCGGNARTSIQWRMMEAKRLGIYSAGTKHFFDLADEISVPEWIASIDGEAIKLPVKAQLALRARYIMDGNAVDAAKRLELTRHQYDYWIGIAHKELIVLV